MIPEDMDDRVLPGNDHDLLIRLHERVISLTQTIQTYLATFQDYGKRIETLEQYKSNQAGIQSTNLRNSAIITTIISSVLSSIISGVLIYIFTHTAFK